MHKIPVFYCTLRDAYMHFPRLKCWSWMYIRILVLTCVSATMFSSGFRWTVKASLISLIPSKITSMLTICWVSPSLNSISTNAKITDLILLHIHTCSSCQAFLTVTHNEENVCVCVHKMESRVWKTSLIFTLCFASEYFPFYSISSEENSNQKLLNRCVDPQFEKTLSCGTEQQF